MSRSRPANKDEYVEPLPVEIPEDLARELTSIQPWKTVYYWLLQVAGIAIAIILCVRHFNVATYVLAVAWIGARQHALGVMMHDGVHQRLFKSKTANDLFADLFCAWPLLISVTGFRRNHWPHHRDPDTKNDPTWMTLSTEDWHFNKKWSELLLMFARDVTALNLPAQLRTFRRWNIPGQNTQVRKWNRPIRLAYYAVLVGVITYFGGWKYVLLFWLVPSFTWLKMILRLRSIAEHYGLEYDHPLRLTRTTIPNWLERLFIAPYAVGYHIEHHLYPATPFYHLRRLHRTLMQDPRYASQAHISRGYANVLRDCVHCARRTPLEIADSLNRALGDPA